MGRVATGVRALRLDNDGEDEIIGMVVLQCNEPLSIFPDENIENEEIIDNEVYSDLDDTEDNELVEDESDNINEQDTDYPETIMVVSEKGFGKRSVLSSYRITNRGGKGVKTLNITEKTGKLIALKSVTDDDDLMIINKSGVTIRLALKDIKIQGRNTQGVSLINLKKRNDVISSVCKVAHYEEDLSEFNEDLVNSEDGTDNTNENINEQIN
jgi:DNA gyrase subunit A